jgi:type VI secretion system protein ImpH
MATAGRTEDIDLKTSSIEEALREDPCSFEFFQAVALLQRLRSDLQPVGRFSHPEDEVVHFRAHNRLPFPASQIQSIAWPEDSRPEMAVNFMGITGPSGLLPYCYTELLVERARAKDRTFEAFLDIFNHRMISFFYRAWEKYRFPVTHYLSEEDLFTHHLLDLVGLGTPGLQNRQGLSDEALLHYAALLGSQARSAEALQHIISDYFEVPVEIEQFVGAWNRLDDSNQCRMDAGDSESEELGKGAVVGDEIWDQQSRVRIILGPLTLAQYRDFLPSGSAYEPLRAFTRFFSNDEFDFELQLILKREEVPALQIGSDRAEPLSLGWISWLKSAPIERDPGETVLNL